MTPATTSAKHVYDSGPFTFELINDAVPESVDNKAVIYIGSAGDNSLRLVLTNSGNKTLTLKGGDVPDAIYPEVGGPTVLYLSFGVVGDVFTDAEVKGVSIKVDGWHDSFLRFDKETKTYYLGLCPKPTSTVTLPPAERRSFTLRNVACSYTGTHSPIHKATIDYFNLGTIPDGNWPLRLQVTSKSSNKKKAPLSIDILRCNAPDSTCWITTRALDEANMSVSTDLELTVTNTSDEALKPPPFTLSFVESPRGPGNGAVTSADNIRKIGTKGPIDWSMVPDSSGSEQVWKLEPGSAATIPAKRSIIFQVNNIIIPSDFAPGVGYAYLEYNNWDNYLDTLESLQVFRIAPTPSVKLKVSNAHASYQKNTQQPPPKATLGWTSFAVPYLQLEYTDPSQDGDTLVYLPGANDPNDQEHDLPREKQIYGPVEIPDTITFTLSAYESRPRGRQTHGSIASDQRTVTVQHIRPEIKSFLAACTPTEAILTWDFEFTGPWRWLTATIQAKETKDANWLDVATLTNANKSPVRQGGKLTYGSVKYGKNFSKEIMFRLFLDCHGERAGKDITPGSGLTLISSFQATPRTPRCLGAATTDFQFDVQFSSSGGKASVYDSSSNRVYGPVESGQHSFTSQSPVDKGANFHLVASWTENSLEDSISCPATFIEETIDDYLTRHFNGASTITLFHLPDYGNEYSHDVGRYISIGKDFSAQYLVNMGTLDPYKHNGERVIVAVQYLSKGRSYLDPDGHYYFDFDGTNHQVIPSTGNMDGYVYGSGVKGEYKVNPVKPFRFMITPKGVKGGPDWRDHENGAGISFGWYGYSGWHHSERRDGATESMLSWS